METQGKDRAVTKGLLMILRILDHVVPCSLGRLTL